MSFREHNWKHRYVSSRDDVLTDFYVPALQRSKYYSRIAGYFNSSVLSSAAQGVASFIENGEQMRLVVSADISEDDAMAINRGERTPADVIETNLSNKVSNIEKSITEERLEVLAWMVSTGQLSIKIGFNQDEDGNILPPMDYLWHEKVILFEDEEGNKLHIDGSINETTAGWTKHRESFSVHRGWEEGQEEYVQSAAEEFRDVWEDNDPTCQVFSIPTAIENELLEFKPSSPPKRDPVTSKQEIELWPPQKRAIENWENNDYRGVFELATGTGKTLASLFAAADRLRPDDFLLILVPYQILIEQWVDEIKTPVKEFNNTDIIRCSSDYDWKEELGDFILRNQGEGENIIIATMDTVTTDRFQNIITEYIDPENLLLVIDEVHNIGSPNRRKFLENVSANRGRIGLSATPERMWDQEGTQAILDYFDGKVIEYGIEEAIDPDIDGQSFLCPYEYHVHFVSLNDRERMEYKKISNKIGQLYAQGQDDESDALDLSEADERIKRQLIKRSNILKQAEAKVPKAIEITETEDNLDRCLIYCSESQQLEEVKQRLLSNFENVCKYTSKLDDSQRKDALQNFKTEVVNYMTAIKCLDEGVDIPACDSAIILASSRNPRQFIQRRGRVLRQADNKDKAVIHDLVVLPYSLEQLKNRECEVSGLEFKLLERELERVESFRKTALNSTEVLMEIQDIKSLIRKNMVRK